MGNGETLRTGYGDEEEYARQEIVAPVWHTPLTLWRPSPDTFQTLVTGYHIEAFPL